MKSESHHQETSINQVCRQNFHEYLHYSNVPQRLCSQGTGLNYMQSFFLLYNSDYLIHSTGNYSFWLHQCSTIMIPTTTTYTFVWSQYHKSRQTSPDLQSELGYPHYTFPHHSIFQLHSTQHIPIYLLNFYFQDYNLQDTEL